MKNCICLPHKEKVKKFTTLKVPRHMLANVYSSNVCTNFSLYFVLVTLQKIRVEKNLTTCVTMTFSRSVSIRSKTPVTCFIVQFKPNF